MILQLKETIAEGEWGKACFAPLIREYKRRMAQENSSRTKESFYQELTFGQKQLFVFYVYYEHAIESETELYWWSAYFIAQPKTWAAIKAALELFGDHDMLEILLDIEKALPNTPDSLESFTITRDEVTTNEKLQQSFQAIYEQFSKTAPRTNQLISNYIKKDPSDFYVQGEKD